jgi:hypothetical protein
MRTIELCGKELIPKLEKLEIDTTATMVPGGTLNPETMAKVID